MGAEARDRLKRAREIDARLCALTAELDELVGLIDRERDWAGDRHRSVKGYLRAELNWSDTQIADHLRAVRLAADVPEVGVALGAGTIGVSQARLFGRASANPRCGRQLAEFAGELLEHARALSYNDFRLVIERWEQLADADGSHRDAELTHATRSVVFTISHGVGRIEARGGALDTAEMKEIWERLAHGEFLADWDATVAEHGDAATAALMPRTDGQRGWDALLRICRTAASTPAGSQLPEPTLNISMDVGTFERTLATMGLIDRVAPDAAQLPVDQWRCETREGVLVDPFHAVTAAMAGHIRRIVFGATGEVVDLGRRRRWFTGAVRQAVQLTASRCVWPGCSVIVGRCQIDHIIDWQRQGSTNTGNGAVLCGKHNRDKNQGYRITRDQHGHWHTYRPDGSEIAPSEGRSPPTVRAG
jgi:hypothetical protein